MRNKLSIKLIFLLGLLIFTVVLTSKYSFSNANLEQIEKKISPKLNKEFESKELTFGNPIFIRIFKESSELEVWVQDGEEYKLFKNYPICTFSGELGPKIKEWDRQSPEGFYFVKPNQMNPNSSFHLSFNIGFPNKYDRAHGRTGSYLMVHGNCVSAGCYAMTDPGIEEIYLIAEEAFKNGQPFFRVHIFPFRMTEKNMKKHANSKWKDFWENLKEGYDHFEKNKTPPDASVKNKTYIFEDI